MNILCKDEKKCINCEWWRKITSFEEDEDSGINGVCHRFPPTGNGTFWLETRTWENNWCGEFKWMLNQA